MKREPLAHLMTLRQEAFMQTIENTTTTTQQVSPDGQWIWNGTEWVPNVGAAPVAPVAAKRSRKGLKIAGGVLAAIAMLGVVSSVAGASETPAANETTTSAGTNSEAADKDDKPAEETQQAAAEEPAAGPAVGDTLTVGDWEVVITEVDTDADSEIAKANQFNEDAEHQYVLVSYSATYVGDESSADAEWDLTFSFAGSDNVVYDPAMVVTPMDDEDVPTEARAGGTVEGDIAFDVPPSALEDGVIIVEETMGFDEVEVQL